MPTDRKPIRWGVRTLAYLGLVLLSMAVSALQGHYTMLSLTGVLIGLVGATVCTVRGISTILK